MNSIPKANKEYIVASLKSTVGNQAIAIAEMNARIAQLIEENERLQKELIDNMDADKDVK